MPNTLPVDKLVPKKGSIAYFAPDGDTIETVVVSKTAVPAGSDFTDWKELGCIEDAELLQLEREGGEPAFCFSAASGAWEEEETDDSNAETMVSIQLVLQKVTAYLLQMGWGAATIGSSDGAFVPATQPGGVYRGWIYMQVQRGTELEVVVKLRAELKITNNSKLANRTVGHKPQVTAKILTNSLNSGTMGTNS